MARGGGLWAGGFACDRPAHELVLSCVRRFTNLGSSSPSGVSFNQMVKRQNTEDLTKRSTAESGKQSRTCWIKACGEGGVTARTALPLCPCGGDGEPHQRKWLQFIQRA